MNTILSNIDKFNFMRSKFKKILELENCKQNIQFRYETSKYEIATSFTTKYFEVILINNERYIIDNEIKIKLFQIVKSGYNLKKNLEILTTYKCNFTCDYCDINYLNQQKADLAASFTTLGAILNENDITEVATCVKEPILDSNFSNIRDFTINCLKLSQKFRIDTVNIMMEAHNYNAYFKKLKSLFITQINIDNHFII